MLLAVDVGNTQTTLGVFQEDKLVHTWRYSTNREETGDELAVTINGLLSLADLSLSAIDGLVVSSVVPHCTLALLELSKSHFSFAPLIVKPGIKTGLSILYENPQEVGADRIANAVGAKELFGPPALVVDFGTATTFDVLSPQGEYLGGAIAPGLETAAEALFTRAARLSRVELSPPPQVVGRNTQNSLQSGILFGFAALVDGLVRKIQKETGFESQVIATGGLASLMKPLCQTLEHLEPDLTLWGLKFIWEKNK